MSLKTYVPSNIETEVERVRENDSKVGPTYLTTSLTRPTALLRNLQDASTLFKVYEVSTVPLQIPDTHSSGFPQNSRSFDYDYLIANDSNSDMNHFFILDTGSISWAVRYLEKTSQNSFRFVIENFYENEQNINLATLSYKLLNSSNIVENLVSNVDNSTTEAYAIDYLDNKYDISISVENTSYLNLSTSTTISERELDDLKNINIITGYKNKDYKSEIRFFNKVSYDSDLNDYFIHNSAERFSSLKSYLVDKNVKAHPAYAGVIRNNEGLMFNIDLVYNNTQDLTDSLETTGTSLGRSEIEFANSNTSLVGFTDMIFKVPDNDTDTIESVEILKFVYNSLEDSNQYQEVSLGVKVTDTNPESWYNFLKPYGILAVPILKKVVTTSSSYEEVQGEFEGSEPILQEVVTEDISYILKGLALKVLKNIEAEDERYFVRFKTSAEGFAKSGTEDILTSFETPLVHSNSFTVYPSIVSFDTLVKTYSLGYKSANNSIDNSFSLEINNSKVDYNVKIADATTLDISSYTAEQETHVNFTVTPFFNKGLGFESNLNALKEALETFPQISVLTDPRYSYLMANSLNVNLNNLYVTSTETDTISTASSQSLSTRTEILFQIDSANSKEQSFKGISQLPYVILDVFSLKNLQITPFAYVNKEGSLLKEQDIVQLDYIATEDYELGSDPTHYNREVVKELEVSPLSLYFLPIVPLFNNDSSFSNCFAIFYDPCTVEGVSLKNALVNGTNSAIIDETADLDLKYRHSTDATLPVYSTLSSGSALTSEVAFDDSYFEIKANTSAFLTGYSFEYSLNDEYNVTFELSNIFGEILESLSFSYTNGVELLDFIENLESDYLDILYTVNNILRVSVKPSASDSRYVVKIVNNNGGDLVSSKLMHEIDEKVSMIPLNRS